MRFGVQPQLPARFRGCGALGNGRTRGETKCVDSMLKGRSQNWLSVTTRSQTPESAQSSADPSFAVVRIGVVHDGDHPSDALAFGFAATAGERWGQRRMPKREAATGPRCGDVQNCPTRFLPRMGSGCPGGRHVRVCEWFCQARIASCRETKAPGIDWTMSGNALRDHGVSTPGPWRVELRDAPAVGREGGSDADAHGCNLGQEGVSGNLSSRHERVFG